MNCLNPVVSAVHAMCIAVSGTLKSSGRLVYQLQSSEFLSARTSQLIVVEGKHCQLNELPKLCRDGTCKRIFGHKLSKW